MIPNLDSKWLKGVRRQVPAKFSTLCDGCEGCVALRLEAPGQWFRQLDVEDDKGLLFCIFL